MTAATLVRPSAVIPRPLGRATKAAGRQLSALLLSAPARKVISPVELDGVYRFRYQVFCQELGFWDPRRFPDRCERDSHDAQASHFAVYDGRGGIAASIRLVVRRPFPLEAHCPLYADAPDLARNRAAEVSRLAVAGRYRRCKPGENSGDPIAGRTLLIASLYKALAVESRKLGVTHWLAAMEKSLFRILRGFGCPFEPIGPEVDYSGPVRPYLAETAALIPHILCMG